ncbi:GNAT family N-acetyltransferase [Epibacterium sp. SM1969]|uniref:GNAT family N-acetyltransferase n=1 Tax=Tritonibacter aquimaris TaxID=2663379 RepID=A0A844AZ24_9RHOB|nr:GNAT family N-acetyltransferase [Tritonibacter aquimaris]
MSETEPQYYELIERTWPCATATTLGNITLREGQGGGSRVSCATVDGAFCTNDLQMAAATMREMGQQPLFMVRDGESELDTALESLGFVVKDPVFLRAGSVERLAATKVPPVTAFEIWPPLAIQRDIWAKAGIGPARLAVMQRADVAKTALLGRIDDQPAGVGFVAVSEEVAMVHALEVDAQHRRKGLARYMMHQAAIWAQKQNAQQLMVLVTQANQGANLLYQKLGLDVVGAYHYRVLHEDVPQ